MEAKSIERIAEELGVNFYDLHPLIAARDEFHVKAGRKDVVEWLKAHNWYCVGISNQLKEWGIE